MRRFRVDFVIGDVAFSLQDPHDFGFNLRVRDVDLHFLRTRAVAHPSKQICNWICNGTHEIYAACAAAFFARSENGIPISLNSDLASSSVRAEVTIVTSKPMLRLILSSSTSGKMVWSVTPSV